MSIRTLLTVLLLAAAPAAADTDRATLGGDLFVAGSGTETGIAAERDLFVAGGTVGAEGEVAQDAHFAGADVEIGATIADDAYAAGGTVTLRGSVGEDLTAMGFSVRVADGARVEGNARLAGGSVVVDGPVGGALLATGGEVVIDAEIGGDVRIAAGELRFGPNARIAGRLDYTAPQPAAIPPEVVDPARVTFTQAEEWEGMREMHGEWMRGEYPTFPTASAVFGFLLITIGFFVVLGAVALALAPERVEAMREEAMARPGLALLGGVLGLATAFGLVPIAAMTILGLPLLPVVLILIFLLWIAGYGFGVYAVAIRLWTGLAGPLPHVPARLGVFALGLLAAALLNAVPFLGWVVNFTLVLFGIGAIAVPLYRGTFARAPAL